MSMNSPKKKSRMSAYGPAIGLLTALAAGVLAYALSGPVDGILKQNFAGFREMPADKLQIFTTIVLFVVFVLLVSLVVAASAPKRKSAVNEKDMIKERQGLIKEKQLTKLRRKQMNKMNTKE